MSHRQRGAHGKLFEKFESKCPASRGSSLAVLSSCFKSSKLTRSFSQRLETLRARLTLAACAHPAFCQLPLPNCSVSPVSLSCDDYIGRHAVAASMYLMKILSGAPATISPNPSMKTKRNPTKPPQRCCFPQFGIKIGHAQPRKELLKFLLAIRQVNQGPTQRGRRGILGHVQMD